MDTNTSNHLLTDLSRAKALPCAIPESEWKWYGYAGHFIGGKSCAYHLSTRIGGYLVSTVGDYYSHNGVRTTLGASKDSWFETMVFPCAGEEPTGDPIINDWSSIDGERYAESLDAENGHYRYCKKYAAMGVEAN